MVCRCTEIQDLTKTIGRLNEARSYLSNYNTNLSVFKSEIAALCSNVNSALYTPHADEVKVNLNKKAGMFSPISIDMERKISVKVSELLNDVRKFQEEDKTYHEEERKRLMNLNNTTNEISESKQ